MIIARDFGGAMTVPGGVERAETWKGRAEKRKQIGDAIPLG